MRLGLNLPWIRCGHDFGLRPPAWNEGSDPPERDWEGLGAELARWRAELGIEVVRFWVLAAGVNYPVGENPLERFALTEMRPEGALVGRGFERIRGALVRATWQRSERLVLGAETLPALPPAFLADFEALFRAAGAAGMKLMPSLCSFELFLPAQAKGEGVLSRGRGAFVFGDSGHDPHQIERFFDATLEPLLDVAARHPGVLEAFEVVNEPDWCVEGGPAYARRQGRGVRLLPKTVARPMMARFLERGVERIVARGARASIGFKLADPPWLEEGVGRKLAGWGAAGAYVHQIHHYPSLYEPWLLPRHETLPIQPCIVGEMPTRRATPLGVSHGWWHERLRDIRRAGDPDDFLRRRLEIAAERGYPAALVWAAKSGDTMTDWSARTQAQLARFTGREGPRDRPSGAETE